MKKQKFDLYEHITNQILEKLDEGNVPWIRPWDNTGKNATGALPYNAVSQKSYQGVNLPLLWCRPFESTAWMSYKQAKQLGGQVKKGERGTIIVFWTFIKQRDKTTGEETTFPFLRYSNVFNIEQTEDVELKPAIVPDLDLAKTPLEFAESNGARVTHGGKTACFLPGRDKIQMPIPQSFENENGYAQVLYHELTHWTGHENRLNRNFSGRFGDEAYAFEELIAEMGSAFLCANLGVELNKMRHTGYIQSWIKVLRGDKKAFMTACTQAKKACTSLLERKFVEAELLVDASETQEQKTA